MRDQTRADATRADIAARGRPPWALPVVASAVTAGVTATAVALAFALTGASSPAKGGTTARPGASVSSTALAPPPSTALTGVTDPCSLVTRATVDRLVPQPASSADGTGPMRPGTSRRCDWDQPGHWTDVVDQVRHLSVHLTLDGPNDAGAADPRAASAQHDFTLLAEDARKRSGDYADTRPTSQSRQVFGPFRPVDGLGIEAFTEEYRIIEGPPLRTDTGFVELTAAYRNLLIEISYRGEDTSAGKPAEMSVAPLPATTLRAEALAVARELVTALGRCAACRR
ncbi:hypothetical protein AB0L06_36415 [Spirillospora sp. NPDC052269]